MGVSPAWGKQKHPGPRGFKILGPPGGLFSKKTGLHLSPGDPFAGGPTPGFFQKRPLGGFRLFGMTWGRRSPFGAFPFYGLGAFGRGSGVVGTPKGKRGPLGRGGPGASFGSGGPFSCPFLWVNRPGVAPRGKRRQVRPLLAWGALPPGGENRPPRQAGAGGPLRGSGGALGHRPGGPPSLLLRENRPEGGRRMRGFPLAHNPKANPFNCGGAAKKK